MPPVSTTVHALDQGPWVENNLISVEDHSMTGTEIHGS